MSSKRQLKRNFSDTDDSDSKSESESEMHKASINRSVKRTKICLESDSENELALSEQNVPKDESLSSASDEDIPLSKVADVSNIKEKNSEICASSDSSDDEPLAGKISTKELENNKKIKNLDSGFEKNGDESTSDKKTLIRKVATKASKFKEKTNKGSFCSDASSDSSEDEPLDVKKKNLPKHSKNLNSDSESDADYVQDEPLSKSSEEKVSDSSGDEPLAKTETSQKNLKMHENTKMYNTGSEEDGLETTSDEDEPISKMSKATKSKESEEFSNSSNSSDDEPLVAKSQKISAHLKTNKKAKNLDSESEENRSGDGELASQATKFSKKSQNSKANMSVSDSDDEPLVVKGKASKQMKNSRKNKKSQSVANGVNPSPVKKAISKMACVSKEKGIPNKNQSFSSSSDDDEPLATKKVMKQKSKEKSDVSSDEEDKPISNLAKAPKEKLNPKKAKTSSSDKIEHLKKYMRIAGIHINSYDKFFGNCKSIKSKTEKLLGLLQEKGLKGRPTIEKCKRLKKKIETKKEISELDTSNIIKSEGRPKRGSSGTPFRKEQNKESTPVKKKFSRLQDIIDSEESD